MSFDLIDIGESLIDLGSAFSSISTMPVTLLGPGDTFSQAQGTIRRYGITLQYPDTQAPLVGIFDQSVALRAFIWEGGTGPTLATPSVSWNVATSGTLFLDVEPDDLAGLQCQPYPIRIEVDRGGQWQEGWDGWADVLYEPSTTASPYAPGSYQDMLDKGGTAIKQLLTIDSRAGFLSERAEAWLYLRQVLLARYRPVGLNRGTVSYIGSLPGYWVSSDYPNPVIAGYLDSGKLLITDQIREILARKALGILFDRQQDAGWKSQARREHLRADWLIQSLAAGIDLVGNGYPTIVINCGVLNTRDI